MSTRGGVCIQGEGGLHHGGLGRPPPQSNTMGCGQQVGGMHPTGMHSCFNAVAAVVAYRLVP